MREIGSTNIALWYLSLEAIGKKLSEEEALFDYFDWS